MQCRPTARNSAHQSAVTRGSVCGVVQVQEKPERLQFALEEVALRSHTSESSRLYVGILFYQLNCDLE